MQHTLKPTATYCANTHIHSALQDSIYKIVYMSVDTFRCVDTETCQHLLGFKEGKGCKRAALLWQHADLHQQRDAL